MTNEVLAMQLLILKSEMRKTADPLELKALSTYQKSLKSQFKLLDATQNNYTNKLEHDLSPDNLKDRPKTSLSNNDKKMYLFRRKIRGGYVQEISGYVPEAVVRNLGLEDGDRVYAEPIESEDSDKIYYNYSLAKKRKGELIITRVQYNYCPVIKEAGRYVVKESLETGEAIRYNEQLFTVILKEDDVFDLKIIEGNTVDIAFPLGSPEKAKVVWKHGVESIEVHSSRMYLFRRKLRGGYIQEISGYVPEAVVRNLGLEDGDKVYVEVIDSDDPDKIKYNYSLAKKREVELITNRVQYNYCPVIKEAGRYVVKESLETGEAIRYKEQLFTVILKEDEVFDLKINEGDIVDIAFLLESPEKAKVVWKHGMKSLVEYNQRTSNNKKNNKLTEKKQSVLLEQTLEGKTIMVVGNEGMKSSYRDSVIGRGGEFLWADSDFKLARLEAMVRKADVCVYLLTYSGHTNMKQVKRLCKEYDVPFETTWSNGSSTVIRIAENR